MWLIGTSLVVQWLGVRLPVQRTQVRSLVQEDPTCRRAAKPMCHNYWPCTLEPACLEPATTMRSLHSLQLEKARAQQQRPNGAKKMFLINKFIKCDLYSENNTNHNCIAHLLFTVEHTYVTSTQIKKQYNKQP